MENNRTQNQQMFIDAKLEQYRNLLKLLRRYVFSQALIGEEIEKIGNFCPDCYESVIRARELLKEIDKILY